MDEFDRVLADATLPALLALRASQSGDAVAFRVPTAQPATPDSTGRGGRGMPADAAAERAPAASVGWVEHHRTVSALAAALAERGIGPGARVGILAPTSLRWEAAQMAVLANGAIAIGLDPNYPDADLARLIDSIELDALFVHDAALQRRVAGSSVPIVVRMHAVDTSHAALDGITAAIAFDDLLAQGQGRPMPMRARPDDAALMVFSSGTTGHPKPIVYTHRQVLHTVGVLSGAFPMLDAQSRLLCWLPLANLFQRMINFCAIRLGAASYVIDDPRTVMQHLPLAAPHLLIGVPRFFERVHAGIRAQLDASPGPVRALGRQAIDVGVRAARLRLQGEAPSPLLALRARAADALVLARLRVAFGGQVRCMLSGSAPMPRWLLEFYEAIGMPVYEAYGVSECIVPVAMNRPGARRLGTVGRPVEGNEVAIAADGEVRVRGPGVFSGYWHAGPQAARPDAEGFWATGDLGEFDADGFLRLSGRKADVFKLSTGRWVAPAEVEELLRQIPGVDHVVVLGESRKAAVAVLTLEPGIVPAPNDPARSDAARSGRAVGDTAPSDPTSGAAARVDSIPADAARIQPLRQGLAARLSRDAHRAVAALADYQRPAVLVVAGQGFSIEAGELTSNLKVRRRAVAERFAAPLEAAYASLERRSFPPESDRARSSHAGPIVLFADDHGAAA